MIKKISYLLMAFSALCSAQQWEFTHGVITGGQLDAAVGPDHKIHVISGEYAELSFDGQKILSEDIKDDKLGALDFPPAITVGTDHSVHIVTRHGGSWSGGHNLKYRRRNAAGTWDLEYQFGEMGKRNYVVGATYTTDGPAILSHTIAGDNVWGDVHLYRAEENTAVPLGQVGGVWRADNHARLKSYGNTVYLYSGKNNPNGKAYIGWGDVGDNLASSINGNMQTHQAGSRRKGYPDISIGKNGTVHMVYGAHETLYYNSYDVEGARLFQEDKLLFENTGEWHISSGLGAVAVSNDGKKVVAVVLKTDGTKKAGNCDIWWRYSEDGGETWSKAADAGVNTSGGEGRKTPRLLAIQNRFFLIYDDKENPDISVGILDLGTSNTGINRIHEKTIEVKSEHALDYFDFHGRRTLHGIPNQTFLQQFIIRSND